MKLLALLVLCCAVAHGASAPEAAQLACLSDPTAQACSSFTVGSDELEGALEMLCDGETVVTGCSMAKLCSSGKASGNFCDPFSLVATTCTELAATSASAAPAGNNTMGCELVDALCVNGSKVPQCSKSPAVPNLVTSKAAIAAMQDMCGTHFMPTCLKCGNDGATCADPLSALASACKSMPGMYECQGFTTMCGQAAVAATFKSLCS